MAIKPINSTTFQANELGDVKPKVIIGGTDASKFVPNINASFSFNKDDEFFININRSEKIITNQTVEITSGVIKQTVGIERDEIYIDANGKLKWDTVYASKPPVMKLVYDITFSPGIEFLFQPELTAAEIARGVNRPDDIVGSYAVYCNRNGKYITIKKIGYDVGLIDAEMLVQGNPDKYEIIDFSPDERYLVSTTANYRTGKLLHIPRPFVIDSLGKREWCSQVIKDGKLTITLPKAFMDSATYPVRLDPTFGYTSVGGSTDYWSVAKAAKATSTPASNGDVTSISCYCSTSGTSNLLVALYSDSTGPATRLAYNNTGSTVGASAAWVTSTLSCAVTASTQYWLGFQRTDGGSNIVFAYDSGSNELALSTSGSLNDPFSVNNYQSQRVSIYATYTESGGGSSPVRSIMQSMNQFNGGMI